MSVQEYGAFSEDGLSYIIHSPRPPRPWINYLTNGDYCSLVSQVGGGFSFYMDHRHHGVLRRELRQHTDDLPARLWYVQDADGVYWTANAHFNEKPDCYQAQHGFGKTSILTESHGIQTKLTWFVAPGINGEFCRCSIRNLSDHPRRLRLFSYQEFVLGSFDQDCHERTFSNLFYAANRSENTVWLRNNRWSYSGEFAANEAWPFLAYVTCCPGPFGVTADRADFVGYMRNPACPFLLECGDSLEIMDEQRGIDPAVTMQWNLDLQPQEEKELVMLTGICDQGGAEPRISRQLADLKARETEEYWAERMAPVMVRTPDPELDRMVNFWNKYQMFINNSFGRGPSYYHKDQYPAMRDCCQDSFGVLPLMPEDTRAKLVRIFGYMFKDGRIGKGCNRVVFDEEPTDKADLALWMIMAVKAYVIETGDRSILDEPVAFLDGGKSSLYEHLLTGVDRVIDDRGAHGLPLIRNGDWNDALDMVGNKGRGESVWLAQFLYHQLNELIYLLEKKADTARIARYRELAREVKRNLEVCHWDGQWFVRAFDDQGERIGSSANKEASIYLNTQTWAVIAGLGTDEQRRRAMASVDRYLETDWGLANLYPAYSQPDPSVGIISRFLPGHKENGAVFAHATAFNLIAKAMVGDGEGLYRLYKKSLPCARNHDVYAVEPYVYSQFAAGPASARAQEGAYHWLTGTAAWMFRAIVDYMLGVQPTDDGLRVAPCLPKGFLEYTVVRRFRHVTYTIHVFNPGDKNTGDVSLTVNGVPIDGDTIPIMPHDSRVDVQIV